MPLIKKIKITWLSPERVERLSFGAITNHKMLNTRSFKPELGGIFDPLIFGSHLSYECYCGEYKGKQNDNKKCKKCGVLIAEKNIQRWRMGHIDLACPVINTTIFKVLANDLSKLLGISVKDLENIIYFKTYIVLDNGLTELLKKNEIVKKEIDLNLISDILQEIITNEGKKIEEEGIILAKKLKKDLVDKNNGTGINTLFLADYLDFFEKYWEIKIGTGAEALEVLLNRINIDKELKKIKLVTSKRSTRLHKASVEKKKFLESLQKTEIKLKWIVIHKLPVIPCGLRQMTRVKEKNNAIAMSQKSRLYHKVILVNEKLTHFLHLNKELSIFFEKIHEIKRRLQKTFDELTWGSAYQYEKTKSLLQSLSGKDGILRRYSLGKRADYSARSVIIPNPDLTLDQVGLPIKMALVLYKPFIIKALKKSYSFTVREAEDLLLNKDPIIFAFLDKVVQNHPVLVNRAPSLHRLSIQGFYPQLTLGNSIELHPLVTMSLNADFDGDQVAVHLPLSKKAREEIDNSILSSYHIIDPKNGYLINMPNQDMILGIYYLTIEVKPKEYCYYNEISSIWEKYYQKKISLHDLFVIPACLVARNFSSDTNQLLFTTLGKLIFNKILPPSLPFLNDLKGRDKKISININEITEKWRDYQPLMGWKKKDIGNFLNELVREITREEMVEFLEQLKEIGFYYSTHSGISISPFELKGIIDKKKVIIRAAEKKVKQIDKYYLKGFYSEEEQIQEKINIWEECKDKLQEKLVKSLEKEASFYHIWNSGARASSENLAQIFSMRGNTTNYLGEIIKTPIISSLWEGLTPFEFFISVYGAVKGMIDISLKTAVAGDLTRRLVESSQNIIIDSPDCQTESCIMLEADEILSLAERIYGRHLAQDIFNQKNKRILLKKGVLLLEKELGTILESKVTNVWVFSPLTCESVNGLCQKCYGLDLSKVGQVISLGTAVGIIASQSLGEPGTQLTMQTFHKGGVSSVEDIVQGLPKIKQILDNIEPKKKDKATLAKATGKIISIEGKVIKQKTLDKKTLSYSYSKDEARETIVKQGDEVKKGEKLTRGKIDLKNYLEIMGRVACQNYIRKEVRKIYNEQGINVNEKHIEIFVRQMLSKVEITEVGDSNYSIGEIITYQQIKKVNQSLEAEKKKSVCFKSIILGLRNLSSFSDSFLAGISFQNTAKNLVNYSLQKPIDYLKGCKENLVAGQLIPIGKGFSKKTKK